MTKLNQPFVNTYTTVEALICGILRARREWDSSDPRHQRIEAARPDSSQINDSAIAHLKAEGIDYRTWEPPQPLLIASHEVTASPDGSIRVGCTAVTRAELEAAYKLSTEAMKQEPSWPKWLLWGEGGSYLLRFDGPTKACWVHRETESAHAAQEPYNNYIKTAKVGDLYGFGKPITPLAAKAILEGGR